MTGLADARGQQLAVGDEPTGRRERDAEPLGEVGHGQPLPDEGLEVGRVGLGGLGLRVVGHEAEVCHSWGSARTPVSAPVDGPPSNSAAGQPWGRSPFRAPNYTDVFLL